MLVASALAFLLKLVGHLVPADLLPGSLSSGSRPLPVGLLAALVATQTFSGPGGGLVVDARVAALGVAVVALLLRAPFLLVILVAAATAAALRALGWA